MVAPIREIELLQQEKLELEVQALRNEVEMQRLELRRIREDVIYSVEELGHLLKHPSQSKSLASIETLKKHGLCGGRGGYLGMNINVALKNWMFHTIRVKRGLDIQERISDDESHNPVFFDKLDSKAEEEEKGRHRILLGKREDRTVSDQIRSSQSRRRKMESGWERFDG